MQYRSRLKFLDDQALESEAIDALQNLARANGPRGSVSATIRTTRRVDALAKEFRFRNLAQRWDELKALKYH